MHCDRTFACVSWLHTVWFFNPSRIVCLLFIWCSHMYQNWSWVFSSRRLCLIFLGFAVPLRHCYHNRMSFWCDWQQNQLLSHNPILVWFIPHKINNPLLSSLCGFSLDYTLLYLCHCRCHFLHNHICDFHTDLSFALFLLSQLSCQILMEIRTLSIDFLFKLASSLSLWYSVTIPQTCNKIYLLLFLPCSLKFN